MTIIEVSDENLAEVKAAYTPRPGTKLEFNVHDEGISIVANREGWLSLAEWCMVMAHPELPGYVAPYALTGEVLPLKLFAEGDVVVSLWNLAERPEANYQDVFFHRGDTVGPEYWGGAVKSGNSPYTNVASYIAMDKYRWLERKSRAEVEEILGAPIFERRAPVAGSTVAYTAETPEGWLGVEYDEDGAATWYGFGHKAPWEAGGPPLGEAQGGIEEPDLGFVVIPYEGE